MRNTLALMSGTLTLAACLWVTGCNHKSADEARQYENEQRQIQAHLNTFDDLDFNVFTGQRWTEIGRSHANDITVYWPDGHSTKGVEKHVDDLKAMFVWAPDTRISAHPVKVGQGDWTSVIGVMEGTFSKPMPVGDGKMLPPTGKAFKIRMVTTGHWVRGGVMDEEYLMWDNQDFMKQIGLGK